MEIKRATVTVNPESGRTIIEYDGLMVAGDSIADACNELALGLEARYKK